MKFEHYRLLFVGVGLVGVLLLASPAIGSFVSFPSGEQFSELYVLGPGLMAENYPYNIVAGEDYSVYVGVGNHLGSSASYLVYVKFKNQTDPLPNATSGIPCPLQPLFEYRFSVQDGNYWEAPFRFSVSDASSSTDEAVVNQLTMNNVGFSVNKPALWDSNSTNFSYQLVFELWLYSAKSHSFEFNNRFVDLNLNLTQGL